MTDTIIPPTSPTTPARTHTVGPGEATAGSIVAGLIGAITAYVAKELHVPTEVVTGIFGLMASAAMALWHRFA